MWENVVNFPNFDTELKTINNFRDKQQKKIVVFKYE